ncbi:MAG: hypothetical protein LWX56_15045 [Ignavibacteria bacterium]|nr:hypothetical protein [Ignavibacteria bacterium]
MDLFPLLSMSLLLFSATIVLFLFISFFVYKIKHIPAGRQHGVRKENQQMVPIPIRYETRENIVHSVALPENGTFQYYDPNLYKQPEVKPVITKSIKYEVYNTQRYNNYMSNFESRPYYIK